MPTSFNAQVDDLFLVIEQSIEQAIQAHDLDLDFESQGGMLEIQLPQGTLVLSRQAALQEIWLASPEGGFHFHYANGQWITRQGVLLQKQLSDLLIKSTGIAISFEEQPK